MSMSDELYKLDELHARGALSEDEFRRAKARVIGDPGRDRPPPVGTAINALRRSRDDSWFGGVCGGLARMSGVAAWAWRLIFVALALCGGTGFILYLLLWIFVPLEDEDFGRGADALRAG